MEQIVRLTVDNEASDNGPVNDQSLYPANITSCGVQGPGHHTSTYWLHTAQCCHPPEMTSKMSLCSVANTSAPGVTLGVRSCGCARRFIPQHSQSAPVLARRRSRSSTGSSSKSVGSGRNTPSPSPISRPNTRLKQKSRSESHLAGFASPPPPVEHTSGDISRPCPQPVYFSTTLFIRLGSNRQHYLEQVKYEMKYGPGPFQDEQVSSNHQQQFKTELDIHLESHNSPETTPSNQT